MSTDKGWGGGAPRLWPVGPAVEPEERGVGSRCGSGLSEVGLGGGPGRGVLPLRQDGGTRGDPEALGAIR